MHLDSLVSAVISALNTCSSVLHCRTVHARVITSLNYTCGFIGDQLVSKYIALGFPDDAEKLFGEMPQRKDLVSWNSLISGFCRSGYARKSLDVFGKMRRQIGVLANEVSVLSVLSACAEVGAGDFGRCVHGLVVKLGFLSNVKVVNALINLYGEFGCVEICRGLFDAMPVKSLVSWNSMIKILVYNELAEDGVRAFRLMRRSSGFEVDEASVLMLLQGCGEIGLGKLAEAIHGYIIICGLDADVTLTTALLNLYSKLGRLHSSCQVFCDIRNPDNIAWTAMLATYGTHGFGRDAIRLFNVMVRKGINPDHVTFTHLLSACGHSGLVNEGKKYFKVMSETYGIKPRLDHYSCMVDLLGRAGLLNDAYDLIESMPMEPNSAVWGSLLGACRVYNNVDLGKVVAERLFALDPSDSRNYIMVSNIYSAAGLWTNASEVRALMKERGVSRTLGCSSIEYGNKIHHFIVNDQSHPESEKIYDKLDEIVRKIRKAGHVPKTEFVLHDVDEDVKEDMINKHSEKLAIAFGLLKINDKHPIIIIKNLRICGDCHATAKIISRIEERIIIIRDSKRFHHFNNGICSCGDYW